MTVCRDCFHFSSVEGASLCSTAASLGHFDCLKSASEAWELDDLVLVEAGAHGDIEMLWWAWGKLTSYSLWAENKFLETLYLHYFNITPGLVKFVSATGFGAAGLCRVLSHTPVQKERQRACLLAAVKSCRVDPNDDMARGIFCQVLTQDIMTRVVHREACAVRLIQWAWRKAYYVPRYACCRQRMQRQLQDTAAAAASASASALPSAEVDDRQYQKEGDPGRRSQYQSGQAAVRMARPTGGEDDDD